MVTRRELLKTTATGALVGAGFVASSSSGAADGYWFGDGVNLQPAYYCGGDQDLGWSLMNNQSEINTVRIEVEPPSWGSGHSDYTLDDAKRWIDEADNNGYNVIASCHHYPYNGSGDKSHLTDAAWWWASEPENKSYSGTVYDYLTQDTSITMNLMNEWGDHHKNDTDATMDAAKYANAYNDAVSIIRSNTTYTGDIIIDIPGYAQETHVAADAASDLNDSNLVFSAHIYPSAWNAKEQRDVKPKDLEYLENNASGYDCIIGEFGPNKEGSADWSAIVDKANDLGWPVMAWAWNGDDDTANDTPRMNMVDPFWGDDCSASSYAKHSTYWDKVYPKLGDTETHYLNAEYYDLGGTVTSTSRSGYWGDGYVTDFDDSGDHVTVNFDSATSGNRRVKIRYASPYDDKKCYLNVNGDTVAEPDLWYSTDFTTVDTGKHYFNAGNNEITIWKHWGYYDIDCIIVEA